jgi:hypothetical protein
MTEKVRGSKKAIMFGDAAIAERIMAISDVACNIEDQLNNRYNVRLEFPPRGKDCNDYLMHIRSRCRSGRL